MYKNPVKNYLYSLAADKRKGILHVLPKTGLSVLALLYAFVVALIRWGYNRGIFRRCRLSAHVISVGNITLGGTGKTPLVEMLARALTAKGKRVAILTRGYAGADEANLYRNNLSGVDVVRGKDRCKAGRKAIRKFGADTIILDDGFQHWRLGRDIDIITINANNPYGNGFLYPRGILREDLNALKRADVFFITKTDLPRPCAQGRNFLSPASLNGRKGRGLSLNPKLTNNGLEALRKRLEKINPRALIVESKHSPAHLTLLNSRHRGQDRNGVAGVEELKGKRVALISGIADPEGFKTTVKKLDANVALEFVFPDHYAYRREDILSVINRCRREGIGIAVTTQKDSVRFPQVFSDEIKILVLRIKMEIVKGEDDFFHRLDRVYSR